MNLISTLVICEQERIQELAAQISQSYEVEDLLNHILTNDSAQFKLVYKQLETCTEYQYSVILLLQRKKGPKGFRKLQDEIFQFLKQYSYNRLRSCEEQIVILNLTYYEKLFKQYLNINKKLQITVIFIVSNIHNFIRTSDTKRLNSAKDKIQQVCNIAVKDMYIANVFQLLSAILSHFSIQYKKAKTQFANLFTKIISEGKQSLNKHQYMQLMAICAYYSYLNLQALQEYQLSYYYLTKAHQFACNLGECAKSFISKIKQIGLYKSFRVVRLTRIQNNIQIINRRTKSSWNSKTMKSKIFVQKRNVDNNLVNQQLKNIFTIKDTKATMYKFRKDNMKYLVREQTKLNLNIKKKQEQLIDIQNMRKGLQNQDQIQRIQSCITKLNNQKQNLKDGYLNLKQKHITQLKQIKSIFSYFKGFFVVKQYQKQLYVYEFLYGEMISRAKLFMLSLCLRRRMKIIKKHIFSYKIAYKGIIHLIEIYQILPKSVKTDLIFYKKRQPGFFIKIYPLEKRQGFKFVDDEKKISQQSKQLLIKLDKFNKPLIPFYYEFDIKDGKLITWEQYLQQKKMRTIYLARQFIQRLIIKLKKKKYEGKFQKMYVLLKFKDHISIQTTLFVDIIKLQKQQNSLNYGIQTNKFKMQIYSIGGPKYFNQLYNLSISKTLYIQTQQFSKQEAIQIVRSAFLEKCKSYLPFITTIQKFCKQIYSKKQIFQLKIRNKISIYVIGNDVISFCKYPSGRCFLIVQNIISKDRQIIQTMINCTSSFPNLHMIRQKLIKQRSCKDKIKLTFKFLWTKFFVSQFKNHFRNSNVLTQFQTSYRNRVVFSRMYTDFIYKRKLNNGKIIFSLIVQSLLQFPRPYILRIFTIQNGQVIVDISHKIFNKQKLYYEKNINILNRIVNIVSKQQYQLICEGEQFDVKINRLKRNSTNGRQSRNSGIAKSITNLASQDQIKSMAVGVDVQPKFTSKKSSLLVRYKNRKSNQLSPSFCASNILIDNIQTNKQKQNKSISKNQIQ